MTKLADLGRLKSVPVRDIWPHEAHHFTQWLLQNADVLSDALGMDLELIAAEHPVGEFSLDLIGHDIATGDTVIIENQLQQTDHSHLGQLLTYAGGTDPVNIVWCAPKFRDQHRAALDWLNDRTDENTRFFGIEIGAVQIGDSQPAPLFKLIVEPNDWAKQVHAETSSAGLGPKQKAYLEFWNALIERIRIEQPSWTSSNKGAAQAWITLPFGTTNIWYGMCFTQHGLCVELYFGSSDADENKAQFAKYEALKSQIEADFGGDLSFQLLPERKASRIAFYKPDVDVLKLEEQQAYQDWFIQTFAAFRSAMQKAKAAIESSPVQFG